MLMFYYTVKSRQYVLGEYTDKLVYISGGVYSGGGLYTEAFLQNAIKILPIVYQNKTKMAEKNTTSLL